MCALPAPRSLPYYASPLIGREAEFTLLQELIADPRVHLITVTGTAGIGKTRLSAVVAREHTGGENLFVPLAAVSDPDLVLTEIGTALGLQGDDLTAMIRARLEEWRGVILLDNFEQVIQAASVIAEILPPNPDLTVLVTSQRPLQIEGEHVVRLHPLPIPDADTAETDLFATPSVQLLVNRATEHDSTFPELLTETSASDAIAEICRLLDGIPLALELAASRLNSLSPEVVLAQLERDQSILSSQRRDTPERQRTMHSAIAWSFCLLPAESQRIFLWLGSFTAGFDLDIVERLSGHLQISVPAVDVISEFMSLSLIRRASGGRNPWFSMLASIRQFCLTELDSTGEREGAEAFVVDYVLEIAEQTESTLTGPDSADWMREMDRTFPTVRSCVAWALAHENPKAPMRVAFGMWRFMEKDGRWQELVGWVDRAMLWREKLSDEDLIRGLLAKLTAQEDARDMAGALHTAEEVGQLLEGKNLPDLQVLYLLRLGAVEHDQQHLDSAEALFSEAADLAEHHRLKRDAAMALSNLGLLAFQRGDLAAAEDRITQTIALLRELGDSLGVVSSLSNLGAVMLRKDDLERSRIYLEEALEISRKLGLTRDLIYLLLTYAAMLSDLYERNDDDPSLLDAAEATLDEAVLHAQRISYPVLEAYGTSGLAKIALVRGDYSHAASFILRAIKLASPGDDPRLYPPLGLVTAELMVETGYMKPAAAIIAKSCAYAEETEYIFEQQEEARIETINHQIDEHFTGIEAIRQSVEQWSTDEFVRQMAMAARRAESTSPTILVTVPANEINRGRLPDLTPRENEILELLISGASTQSMAQTLSLSPRTVTTHIGNIMGKLEVSSRAELVAKVMRARQK